MRHSNISISNPPKRHKQTERTQYNSSTQHVASQQKTAIALVVKTVDHNVRCIRVLISKTHFTECKMRIQPNQQARSVQRVKLTDRSKGLN